MPVRANASAVKNRIRKLITSLPDIADQATAETAEDTRLKVAQSAKASLADTEQVGFSLGQFLENIDGIFEAGNGSWAILDTEKMGTVDDFQKIAGVRFRNTGDGLTSLWHLGTRSGKKFRQLVFERAGTREALARSRQQVWGPKTPQWILLEYGSSGGIDTAGADPPVAPRNFIGNVTANEAQIFRVWVSRIRANMRSRGLR